ncbi:nucleotide disphospho-sugar-binding domain-containing protein [Streptomyces sp. NPDC001315]|uniref:nucleotide disphospho-sugar-binding domain-containing protein n=1 Tax=Streptomyces sp. NPDC001315 TaxID=3364562 RepID=UPI00369DED9B
MKVLFVAGASQATLFALAPAATALRAAGHDVIVVSTQEMVPVAERMCVPFAAVTDRTLTSLLTTDRAGKPVPRPQTLDQQRHFAGSWFARLAAVSIDGLLELTGHWRPDLVVGGTSSYAAGLLAAHLGIPQVRLTWDALHNPEQVDEYADAELAPELAALGLDRVPRPDLLLDVCPPSLRAPDAAPALLTRWVPGNHQQRLEPWMLTDGGRQRVCVTGGTRVALTESQAFLRRLAEGLAGLDVEIVVPAPEDVAAELRRVLPGVRTGWMPLDVVAPTCAAFVHHGGGVTAMTAMAYGTPQLVLPKFELFADSWERLDQHGGSITLMPGEQSDENVAKATLELLTEGTRRHRAKALAAEIATLPGPAELVAPLEGLAAG